MPNQPMKGRKDKNNDPESTLKPKRDLRKVKCFNCRKLGHIAPNCPEQEEEQSIKEDEDEKIRAKAFVSWEDDCQENEEQEEGAGTYMTYRVCNAIGQDEFDKYDVLLESSRHKYNAPAATERNYGS